MTEVKLSTRLFTQLIESGKDFLFAVPILFTPDGLSIKTLDNSMTVTMHVKLGKEEFEVFQCTEDTLLMLDVQQLYDFLSPSSSTDSLHIQCNFPEVIFTYGPVDNSNSTSMVVFSDVGDVYTFEESSYSTNVTMPFTEFSETSLVGKFSEVTNIGVTADTLTFSGGPIVLSFAASDSIIIETQDNVDRQILSGVLSSISKMTSFSTVDLSMSPFDTRLRFPIGASGFVKYFI